MKKWILLLVTVWLFSGAVQAQETKQITNQNLIWYGYFNTLNFSEKFFLTTEFQERHFVLPFAQSQFLIRPHLHRKLNDGWDVALGMCVFWQNTNDPYKTSITVPELRPHLEFNQKQKLKRINIEHRYKLESRFFHNTNAARTDLEDGYFFGNFRFRYRLQLVIPLIRYNNEGSLKLKISDELLINAGHSIVLNTFDQNRFYAGINSDITKNISFEIGYLNWFQKRVTDADYYNRHILRFTLSHRINLSK